MGNLSNQAKQDVAQARLTLRQKMAAHPFLVAEITGGVGFVLGAVVSRLL